MSCKIQGHSLIKEDKLNPAQREIITKKCMDINEIQKRKAINKVNKHQT
jgi:hypothetical protein